MSMQIWKPVKGYEGHYEVSNQGQVRSITKDVKHGGNGNFTYEKEGRILKHWLDNRGNYKYVSLKVHTINNGKKVNKLIHRLVGEAHIDNPFNKPEINHIDEIKINNNSSNLEWCTRAENVKYSIGSRPKTSPKLYKEVEQLDLDNNFIAEYKSIKAAAEYVRGNSCNITLVCQGKSHTHRNFKWRYKNGSRYK